LYCISVTRLQNWVFCIFGIIWFYLRSMAIYHLISQIIQLV
jgi:hypothetical protein